jgi:putative membrane protein
VIASSLPSWHVHPDVWLLFGSIVVAYFVACRRHLESTGEATRVRTKRFFLLGMGVLWLGADWPIHDLAERYLYFMHMTQHLLFTLIAAPLLIAGMPAWLLRALLRPPAIRRVFRFMTRPLVALVFFNGVLLFTHWPEVVEASVRSEPVHFALHVLIVASALVMWWPVMSPLPEMPALSPPAQMLYLFFQSLAPTIPASFLTFGHTPLYPVYATFPRIWGLDALTDQLLAGLIMKLVGGLLLWGVIAAIFFRWYNQEQRDGLDPSAYGDVRREVGAGLTRDAELTR